MDQAPSKTAPSGSSENKLSSAASAEASGRMLSFLSQSQLRQQLECQVRYFLSGKLLNCTGDGSSFCGYTGVEQCGEDKLTAKKSLAFKATLSLVLLWLKAHGLVHTAGVLCPEADMRTSDVLSQEECQAVLQFPKALLKRPPATCVPSGLQWNLLDRLIDAASQQGAVNETSSLNTQEVSAAERRASSAGQTRCLSSEEGTCLSGRNDRTECMQRPKRAKGASCPPRSSRKQKIESGVSDSATPTSRSAGLDGSMWDSWRDMAQNKMLLLEAHLKGLELRESSKRLFASNEESRNMLDQRIASLENAYEKRMRKLEKAIDQAAGSQGTDVQDTTMLEAQITTHEARSKLETRLLRQKEVEAWLAEREAKLSERERLLDDREKEMLREALRIQKQCLRTDENETNMLLTQENANFRSQLSQARRQVKELEAQLERQANECMNECVNCMEPAQRVEAKDHEEIARCTKRLPVEKAIAQRSESSDHAATMALKQEYEGHVARLTDEIQRSNDQLRTKDAEFKLLVVELESARRKNAEAQKRLKKMQKLYEAARATCVQHRKLASSMSLSLSCMDFAVEPPPASAEREARDFLGGENVSPNAREPPYIAGDASEMIMNDQQAVQGYGIQGDIYRWSSLVDLNSRPPRAGTYEEDMWIAGVGLPKQNHQPQSSQTAQSLADNVQRCSLAAPERQPLSSGLRTLNTDSDGHAVQLSPTNAVNRTMAISTPPAGSGHAGMDASVPVKCSRISLERISQTFNSQQCGEARDSSKTLTEVSKEAVAASRSFAPLLYPEAVSEAPALHETASAGADFHSAPLKQEAAVSSPKEFTKSLEQDAAMDSFTEQQHTPELHHTRQKPCSNLLEPESNSRSRVGLECEENENMGSSITKQLLPSPENGEAVIASTTHLNSQAVATSRPPARDIPTEVPCREPPTIKITSSPSVERHLKHDVRVENSSHEGLPTGIDRHSTLNVIEASSGKNAQVAVTAASSSPRGNINDGREPSVSTPQSACRGDVPCFSPVANNTPPQRSPLVVHPGSEGCTGSRLQSPWAEASIASSLPESPQGLSNFPSLSCPVAATIEGIPSPTRSQLDSRGGWTAARRKPAFAGGMAASSSPSEHEWLACVSPTDPIIHTNAPDILKEA